MNHNRPKKYKSSHLHPLVASCKGDQEKERALIKKTLIDLGLSQTELGELMGLSLESINQVVNRRRPGTHVLDKIQELASEAGLLNG